MAAVIWITGLPGCGKSTITTVLREKVSDAVIIRMDELRKIVTPEPNYSDAERELVYRSLVYTAKMIHQLGRTVIIDATGNKKSWRQLARELIPDFFEVYLACPLERCMEREKTRSTAHGAPQKIYEKGRAGWPVPGLNVPYEEPENPDLIIDTEKNSPEEAAEKILCLVREQQ